MENSFTSKLNQGKDFSVDHFIIDYAIGCGLVGRDYSLGNYNLPSLLAIISEQMDNATSLQEGMQLRKNREVLKELFAVLPNTVIEDNEPNVEKPDYGFDIIPKEVYKKIKPYEAQAKKAENKPSQEKSKEQLEKDYYRNLYYQKNNEFKYEYLVGLSDEQKAILNEQLKQNKLKHLNYDINEKQKTFNRYSKMISAIEKWNPKGENLKFFLGIKENMIKMLNEGIALGCSLSDIQKLKAEAEALYLDNSKSNLINKAIANYDYLQNVHSKTVNSIASNFQVSKIKNLK